MSTSLVTPGTPNGQFLRFAQIIVSPSGGGQGLSLSGAGTDAQGNPTEPIRFRFEVRASDVETPNTLIARVYNLKQQTISLIQQFESVSLTVGYQRGNQGTIFQGDIKRIGTGRERNVDNYLDIYAGDGDKAYIEAIQNKAFPAGTSDAQTLSSLASTFGVPSAQANDGFVSTGGILPRGKVQFGMARLFARKLATNNDCRWSIQNGVLTLIPNTGFLSSQNVVQINSATGMIGQPEQTDNGIIIRCLINPLIQIGQAVQINNADINQQTVKSQFFPSFTSQYYPASTSDDGLYRVLVVEHFGDTRSNDWYSELTCLVIDKSAKTGSSVLLNG